MSYAKSLIWGGGGDWYTYDGVSMTEIQIDLFINRNSLIQEVDLV